MANTIYHGAISGESFVVGTQVMAAEAGEEDVDVAVTEDMEGEEAEVAPDILSALAKDQICTAMLSSDKQQIGHH